MTPSQRTINELLESQAAEVHRLMKVCDANKIHHANSPHVLHANLKLQGIMTAANAIGLDTDQYRWSKAITPTIFGDPQIRSKHKTPVRDVERRAKERQSF